MQSLPKTGGRNALGLYLSAAQSCAGRLSLSLEAKGVDAFLQSGLRTLAACLCRLTLFPWSASYWRPFLEQVGILMFDHVRERLIADVEQLCRV